MAEISDRQLLAEYMSHDSQEAFAALVRRHINMVYAAAFRQTGDFHKAQEITQVVFLILARKAAGLNKETILSGWLYQTARLTSTSFLRGERRRQHREHEAFMQSTLNDSQAEPGWEQLAPLLDEAMGRLGETDRNVVVLRFFEARPVAEVANAVGLEEWAVRKRLERAVDKLRRFFVKRGVAISTVAICGALSVSTAQTAPPAAFATTIAAAAAKGAATTSSTLTLIKTTLKLMAWTKAKTVIVAGVAILIAGGTTTVVIQHQYNRTPETRPVASGQTEFPKESWAFAGYSNPESAFQSCMWAADHADVKVLLASVAPALKEKLTGKTTSEIFPAKDRADYAKMTGYRILDKQALSDTEVLFEVFTDGLNQKQEIALQLVGNEWKMDMKPKK